MAGSNWDDQVFSAPFSDPNENGWNLFDPVKAAGARALGMGADLGAIVRSLGEVNDEDDRAARAATSLGEFIQHTFGGMEDATLDSISPEAMRAMQATITDPEFYTLLSFTMKGASMAPDIAAAAIPAARFPGMLSAIAISAGQGATFTTGALVDDMYRYTDAMTDEELYEEVPMYRDLIDQGVDPQSARREWNEQFRGMRPMIMALTGGITGAMGVRGIAARQAGGVGGPLIGPASESMAGRIGQGFAEGAVSEAIQSGTEIALMQDAEIQEGFREGFDSSSIATGAVGGAIMGGAAGGLLSAPGGGNNRDVAQPAQEMQPAQGSATTAPNQPSSAAPAPGPNPTPAAGAVPPDTATPTPVAATTVDPVTVQATVDTPDVSTIQMVDGAAPDAAQTVALDAQRGTPQPDAPVTIEQAQGAFVPPPVQQGTPDTNAAPRPPVATTDPIVDTPVATPPVDTPSADTAPVATPPVDATPVDTAPVDTAPVDAAPAPVETGPRILHDPNAPDYAADWGRQVQRNQQEVAAVEREPVGRNRTRNEQAQRQATIEGSARIAQQFPPQDGEAGIVSQRPRDVQAARPLVIARAQAISDAAREAGFKVPRAFRDNVRDSYNPETLLVMEARRLANKDKPTLADVQRFYNRDLSIRLGEAQQVVAERREEGDRSSRRAPDAETVADRSTDKAVIAEARVDREALSPEELLMEAQERRSEAEPVTTRGNQQDTQPLPPGLQRVLDRAVKQDNDTPPPVYGGAKKKAVVETRKTRVLTKKPDAKARATSKPTPKADTAPSKESRLTPKVRDIKERIRSARLDTDTSPTPAQARAGNYRKGSVAINGLTVRIENPKGSTRRNADPRGPRWSVKMRNDYGYIEGTKGRDGDPIDVYLGDQHDAQYVYVVDQVDPQTLAFDEHKVMMGFGSVNQAVQAYRDGFSDGSGVQRMGDIRPMTLDEFKAWLETDPRQRAGIDPQDVAELQAFMVEEALNPTVPTNTLTPVPPLVPDGYAYDPYSGRVTPVVTTRDTSTVLEELDGSALPPAQRYISGQIRRMLSNTVGNVPVHFITGENMARIAGPEHMTETGNPPMGFFTSDGEQSAIFIRSDLMGRPDALRHAVIHEAVHAATLDRVRSDPELRRQIETLMLYTTADLMAMTDADNRVSNYALTDPAEFVSEALSNPEFQDVLSRIQAPPEVVSALNMDRGGVRSAWDALVLAIRRVLGLPANTHTMLEAALRVSQRSMQPRSRRSEGGSSFLIDGNLQPLQAALTERVNGILNRPEMQPRSGRPWLIRLRPLDSLARAADAAFGGADRNPIRKVAKLVEAQRVRANKHYEMSTPLLQKTKELQTRYERMRGENGQSVWENYTALTIDETSSGVYADRPLSDQKHIRKGARDAWARAQHPELARRYNALPAELKAHRQEMLDYFKEQQRNLSKMLIKNRIGRLFDVPDLDAFADRVFNDTMTDADRAILGDAYDAIKAAGVLSKIDGPYFPLMRRGNWVMVARSPITTPGNARQINPNEFEFTSEAEAEAYAAKQADKPSVRTVYVDPQTNETFGVDTDGTQVPLTANDLNAEPRYRVVVQDKTLEMFNTESEARARAAEMANAGMIVDDVVPRRFDNYGAQAEALSPQITRLMQVLERRADARNFTPEQKDNMLRALSEMSLQLMASTRIQTRSMPRRSVAGASKDITQNIHEYAIAMGNYIAKLEVGPQMDAALAEASEFIDTNRNDGMNGARQSVLNEVMRRVTQVDPRINGSITTPVVNRILAVSFLDKLMSPSYSVINATQPYMISMPYLAGNYGVGRAMGAMSKAYRDIGTAGMVGRAVRETARKTMRPSEVPTDPVSTVISRLTNRREREMLEYMVEFGVLDTDAGLEVSKNMRDRRGILGRFDGGISYLEGIARQMPKTVEAINRSVTALAAYRLEMERSGDHTKAVNFAYDTISRTQFNYSHSNAAPYMNHPFLRLATQFKKFGAGMYSHLGEQMGIALDSARTPQERAAAAKALGYTIGMHVLIAGAMGLPTEPIKAVITGMNAMGVTDFTWNDVEIWQREAMADLFGRDIGEALSRGLPRMAGVDLSTRMGIDTLMGPFGEPRSNEAQDLKAYLWEAVMGAPAGLIFDMSGGVGELMNGEIGLAMEKLVPVKAFSDTLKAYRQMTEGTISKSSGRQIMSEYSPTEAAIRAFGFTPAREAEAFERSNMFYRARDAQVQARSDLQRQWAEASGAARGRIWREIQNWNRKQPREVRLSLRDLRNYRARMLEDIRKTNEGLRARRQEEHILDRANSIFNFEP